MLSDLRLAVRALAKSPGFTIISIVTLALGLGVTVAVFGMLNEFMLRKLQVRDPQQLYFLMQRPQVMSMPTPVSYPDYLDLRRRVESSSAEDATVREVLAGLIAYSARPAHVSETGKRAERGWLHEVSDNYFRELGVNAVVGRLLQPGEGTRPGADPVVVLSHAYWTRRFQSDPHVIGQKLLLNGAPFTIIGVTAAGFTGAEAMMQAQIFVPATMAGVLRPREPGALESRNTAMHIVVARAQPGKNKRQVEITANGMFQQLIAAFPTVHGKATLMAIAEAESRPSPFASQFTAPALGALMLLALSVLVVAAANVANLQFARAAETERAMAIRSALGASRWRLVRLILSESVLIAAAAGVLGWMASGWFGALLSGISASSDNPPMATPTPAFLPAVFTFVAALGTGVLTGLFPAWRATRVNVITSLKDTNPAASRARHPLRAILVAGQISLACVVLVCAGLALRSLWGLAHVELGFKPENVLMATFDLEMQRYSDTDATRFQDNLLRRVRELPGVVQAGFARSVPFDKNYGLRGGVGAEGHVPAKDEEEFLVNAVAISPGFQEAMQMTLLSGRRFTEADDSDSRPVVIISRTVAEHYWPNQEPLGRKLNFDGGTRAAEVIGVLADLRYFMMAEAGKPLIFRPLAQEPSARATLVVRTERTPEALASSIIAASQQLDPALPVHHVTTFDHHLKTSPMGLMVVRLGTIIAAVQGSLALVLAVMGIYGLVSFAVARRTREIGIRVALGANHGDVITLVARPSILLTAVGLAIGLAISTIIVRQVAVLLYGGPRFDYPLVGAVTALLLAVTALACWLPARRALRVNPVEALRAE